MAYYESEQPPTRRSGADEKLFRMLVEHVKDYAIFMLDPQGTILTWNRGAELVKGYRADEIIGQSLELFYAEEDKRDNEPWRLLGIAASEGRVEDEGWRVRKDGSRFWADVVITALRIDTGELQGFAKVTRDLTERRRNEEGLRKAQHGLERRVEERTRDLEAANEALREKNSELEKFADIVVGRELRIMGLERRIRELQEQILGLQRIEDSK
jgi:two-component system NtrC family sensor kinase